MVDSHEKYVVDPTCRCEISRFLFKVSGLSKDILNKVKAHHAYI